MGCAGAVPALRRRGHRQQTHRESDAALGEGTQGLVVCRQRTGRSARRHGDELGACGEAERARAVGVSEVRD